MDVVVSAVRGVSSDETKRRAAGSLDGEAMVWDLAIDADAAVAAKGVPAGGVDGVPRSDGGRLGGGNGGVVEDALVGRRGRRPSHRGRSRARVDAQPRARRPCGGVWGGHDGTYELVSAGSDGRVLVWDASGVSHPACG